MSSLPPIEAILTHPGGAHKDELLACCVFLAENRVPVWRREPTAQDLANPAIAVVDVGGLHEPERRNFDHHQFPPQSAPRCALSLVLESLELYDDAREFFPWLESVEWFDCRGPNATAEHLGTDRETLDKLVSTLDLTLLRRFARAEVLFPGDPLWQVMRWAGDDLLVHLRTLRERMGFLKSHAQVWTLRRGDNELPVVYVPRTEQMSAEPAEGLGQYVRHHLAHVSVRALVYPDRRGAGFSLVRHNDAQDVDFTRLSEEDDVHFTHARGFVAKTSSNDPDRLRELTMRAWLETAE